LTVEFGQEIDPRLNARVLSLDQRVGRGLDGVIETVPTYRSLLVHYDPETTDYARLSAALLELAEGLPDAPFEGRLWRIPVVYGGVFGIDLDDIAQRHNLTPQEVIARHAAPVYRVYMIGFLPGFTYLGGLDPSLATPRRVTPRNRTPAGTVSIGGPQALVASIEAPSGWHLLGRTPVRTFMPERDPVFLIAAGDRVVFEPTDASQWDRLDRAASSGDPVAEVIG
jgi:KipI family sensor histidine kinase inhibitor